MCQPKKWWIGLLPLALLWLVATWVSTPKIETVLGQCAAAAIKDMPLEKAAAEVQGRDVAVHGLSFSPDTGGKAAKAAAQCGDGMRRGVTDATALVPEAKPYAWSATRDGSKIALAGNVPNPQMRASINAAAKKAFDGAEVTDTMTYARGAPGCFSATADFGFKELAALAKGSVALAGDQISVAGEPRDFAGYDAAVAALKTPPEGCTVKGAEAILPPEVKPYTWSATRNGNSVTLGGFVPGADVRARMVEAAKAALPGAVVTDTMRVARGAPAVLAAGAAYGLGQLAKLGDGAVSLTGDSLSVSGEAASPAMFAALAEAVAKAPAGLVVTPSAVRPSAVAPFTWSVTRGADAVTLSGFAPSPGAQARIAAAAKAAFPGMTIADSTGIARGAPGGIEAVAAYAMAGVAGLASGTAGIVDSAFSISGDAPTPEAYAASTEALKARPDGFLLAGSSIRAPVVDDFVWSVAREDTAVTLSGFAPSLGARDRIAGLAKLALPGATITDTTLVARGAPSGIEGAIAYALDQAAKLASGTATVRGMQISVAGDAASAPAYLAALDGAAAAPDGYTVALDAVLPPMAVSPFWTATREGNTAVLSGFASQQQIATIAVMARDALPGVDVIDRTQVARGTNGDLEAVASYALGELAKLSAGSVTVTGRDYSIAGEAATTSGYASAAEALKALTGSYAVAAFDVRAPVVQPYVWSATREGNQVILSGNVASPGARERVLAVAKAALPGVEITDVTQVARGAPPGFEAMAAYGLGQLARLSTGLVSANGSAFSIAGDAASSDAFEAAREALKDLPDSFGLASEAIRPPLAKPYGWNAVRGPAQLAMSGSLPSRAAQAAARSAAREAFPGLAIMDTTGIARGAPASMEAAVAFSLGTLSTLSEGSVSLTDGALAISGDAASVQSYRAASEALAKLPAPLQLGSATIRPPVVTPYEWSAASDGAKLVLGGFVPSTGAQQRLAAMAKQAFPGQSVSDLTLVARGAPGGFEALAAYSLGELANLGKGTVSLTESAYSIVGEAPSSTVYDAAIAALKTLPEGATLARADISPPAAKPYVWSAQSEAKKLLLSGFAPSNAARQKIAAQAVAAFPAAAIDNRMQVALGAPAQLEAVIAYGLGELAKLSRGTVSVNDHLYSISGDAPASAAYEAALAAAKKLPSGFALAKAEINPPLQKPYVWLASNDGKTLTLSGSAPNEDAREKIAAHARAAFAGLAVVSKMQIARGAPGGEFVAAAQFGLDQLARLADGRTGLSDQNLSVTGRGRDGVSTEAITAAASTGLPAGFVMAEAVVALPDVRPYIVTCTRTADAILLGGYAPSEALRAAAVAAAAALAPAGKVSETLKLATGLPAPVDYGAATAFCIAEIAPLKTGMAKISDAAFSIAGEAPDAKVHAQVTAALKGPLPGGLKLESAAIAVPQLSPYRFEAVKDAGSLVLSGYYPDEKAHDAIIDAAKRQFFAEKIIDQLAPGPGAPRNHMAAAIVSLDALSRLASGKVSVVDGKMHLAGEARYEKAAGEIAGRIKDQMPAGFEGDAALTVHPAAPELGLAACQEGLSGILKLGTIRFATDSSDIKSESFGLLDALVETAARCPAAQIEISGHTDSVGPADYNQDLSLRRAQAVAAYMTRSGAPLGILAPAGYGLTKPVATNDTDDGRARNRRIEFLVK